MNQNQIQFDKLFLLSQAELATQIDAAKRDVQDAEAQLAQAQQKDTAERDAWEQAQNDFKAAEETFFAARERFRYGGKPMNDVANEVVRAKQLLRHLTGERARRAAAAQLPKGA